MDRGNRHPALPRLLPIRIFRRPISRLQLRKRVYCVRSGSILIFRAGPYPDNHALRWAEIQVLGRVLHDGFSRYAEADLPHVLCGQHPGCGQPGQ